MRDICKTTKLISISELIAKKLDLFIQVVVSQVHFPVIIP